MVRRYKYNQFDNFCFQIQITACQLFVYIEQKIRRQLPSMKNIADIQHAMVKYLKTFEEYKEQNVGPQNFSDGEAFATILRTATNFKISYGDLSQNSDSWTHRLNNLKKIVSLIQEYFEYQINKGIRTKDIELIEIAKNHNVEELAKFFQIIIAVMTEAPNKEDHINTIMSLDERSQSTFVQIIQRVLENRIVDRDEPKQDKIYDMLNQFQNQNTFFKAQIEAVLTENFQLQKQVEQLKKKQKQYEEELEELRGQKIESQIPFDEHKQKEHLKNMIDNLKEKLLYTVREHEMKISGMKEENSILENKLIRYEFIEEEYEEIKRKYSQVQETHDKARQWEKQRSKLNRMIDEKEELIKKLNQRLDEQKETNYAMQQKQLYAKMQLQKRDVRFKQLQKQVKKRYENATPTGISDNSNSNIIKLSSEMNELDQQQLEQLRNDLDQTKRKLRDSERQNTRLKKNMDRINSIQLEKKKLQKLILDVNNDKKQQVQLLLCVNFDLYNQNLKLRRQFDHKKIQV